ncbi:hypothetical protein [Fusibacter ferrireducens]|uniref:Uncharacterized protein n=1 Tax=Fusibacter ferrireducens TaxID=2785058 RepID=A0ABR9ZSR6_9FIRM|nr:hypothetical protein [Fusibacter ferrireducens]MBF4693396.1 hypothetical protein [Fusibacter ferrireducens]
MKKNQIMHKHLKFLVIFIILGLSIYGYMKGMALETYKASLNQSLIMHFEYVIKLADANLNYLDQYKREELLSLDDYQKIRYNHTQIFVAFQTIEAFDLFLDDSKESRPTKRSDQCFYMKDYLQRFVYENSNSEDDSDEYLRSYYTQLKDTLSLLIEKKTSSKWDEEVKVFLDSGNRLVEIN